MTVPTSPLAAFPAAPFRVIREQLEKNPHLSLSGAGSLSAKTLIVKTLIAESSERTVWVVADAGEARALAAHLTTLQDHPVALFSAEHADESERERNIRLIRLVMALREAGEIIVTTFADAQAILPSYEAMTRQAIVIQPGAEYSRAYFFNDLISRGYQHVGSSDELVSGSYFTSGSTLRVMPPEQDSVVTLDLDGDTVERIFDENGELTTLTLLPIALDDASQTALIAALPPQTLVIADELIVDEAGELPTPANWLAGNTEIRSLTFTSFPEEESNFLHLRFLSVLKYVTQQDLLADLRAKKADDWRVVIMTKQADELAATLREEKILFHEEPSDAPGITIVAVAEDGFLPQAFQNPAEKLALLTDRELFSFQRGGKTQAEQDVYLDFITSLRGGDYVVHLDHGIAIFRGIEQQTIDSVTREYLRLDYAEGDKLFVPIDQAEKVNRFIGVGDSPPRLTRLGSAEWSTVQRKVAADTEKVAKELLALYAARELARGNSFGSDGEKQAAFEKGFPYEETPGQLRAIMDVKADMEAPQPMDRLVCGDVGFGKTEVAMRAAFKAALAGKQVAFISPITILADQHFQSLSARLKGFDISCEMLSRFKTAAEQRKIIEGMKDGSVQIVVGTHRLLQSDIAFKDLGLVIIDEEQRFGVKQKEALKKLRNQVDILTMTATPIPRTLNMSLNKLRDITTITTPPPGRLPIVTEVRHFSWKLITEAIRAELARNGQVYFLHNRVATIEGVADRLRELIPEAKFVVTHGQLKPDVLEERILDFKNGEYQVLVSSAIIENGIDLPNANTLIVNNAENFGLSQLYQLRGRVGRSRTQAYAYFLYQTKALKTDAKKRLRAIVEASELGSGFEIAMKDLEIRGAGDILGASQSGAINTIGVSHYVRMLNKAVEDLKAGTLDDGSGEAREEAAADVSLELPITAFIPVNYISDTKEKIKTYQRISAADSYEMLDRLRAELLEEYGKPPIEVVNLLRVLKLKIACRRAGVTGVKVAQMSVRSREAILVLGKKIKPAHIMNLLHANPRWSIVGDKVKINIEELSTDWMADLTKSAETLQTEFRGDDVRAPS